MPLTPDAFAEVLTLPEFSGMRPAERAAVFDAGLADLDGWMKEQAPDDTMRAAFEETRAALGTRFRPAQSDIELDQQSPLGTGWNAFKNLGPEVVGGTVGGLAKLGDAALETVGISDPAQKSWLDNVAGFAEGVIDEGKLLRPTNPANPTAATIGGGAGQAVGMLGTAAASVPALGLKALAAVPAAMGFGMGAGQGIDTAEAMGIEAPAGKLAMGTTFGGIEAATEAIGGIGGRLLPVSQGIKGAVKNIAVEAGEEMLAGTLQDAVTTGAGQFLEDPNNPGFTQNGYQLPSLDAAFFERRKQEAIGGAAGGAVFAGVNALSPSPSPPVSPSPSLPVSPAPQSGEETDLTPEQEAQVLPPDQTWIAGWEPIETAIGTQAPVGGGNVIADFGIQRTPEAQAMVDAENAQRADIEARAQGLRNMAGNGRPMIPDSPLGSYDILDFVNENPLNVMRKGTALESSGDYDWSEGFEMPAYYRKFLVSTERGHRPDALAQMAYDEGLIRDPSPEALLSAMQEQMRTRTQYKAQFRQQAKDLKQAEQQQVRFDKSQQQLTGKTTLPFDDLTPGDEFTINDEPVKIRKIDYDQDGNLTEIVIEDGKAFGVMSLDPQTRGGILVDKKSFKSSATRSQDTSPDDNVAFNITQAQIPRLQTPIGPIRAPGDLVTLKQIRENLLEATLLPRVGVRRYAQRALGIYKVKPEAIRLRAINDLPTLAHEIGHAIHFRQLSSTRGGPSETWGGAFDSELTPLGRVTSRASYTPDQVRDEGVAEFTRLWLTDPAMAHALAPRFAAQFMMEMRALHPEMLERLEESRRLIAQFIAMPEWEKAKSQIVFDPLAQRPKRSWGEWIRGAYTQLFNTLQPAYDVLTAIGKDAVLAPQAERVRAKLENHRGGWQSKSYADIHMAQTDLDGKVVGASLKEILASLHPSEHADFSTYLAMKRAKELNARGIKSGFEIAKVPAAEMAAMEKRFEPVRKKLMAYQDKLLDLMQQGGLLSDKSLRSMREANRDYVPFYRLYEKMTGTDTGAAASRNAGGVVDVGTGIRRIKGSDLAIVDPLQSILRNTFVFRKLAEQNDVGRAFFDVVKQMQGHGQFADSIVAKRTPTKVPHDVVIAKLIEAGVIQDANEIDADLAITMWQAMQRPDAKNGEVIVRDNGEAQHWEIKDPLLYHALKSADADAVHLLDGNGPLERLLRAVLTIPTRLLRFTATAANPVFALKNWFRDQITAGINTQTGFIPFYDGLRGAMKVITGHKDYAAWVMSGGKFTGLTTSDRVYNDMIQELLPPDSKARLSIKVMRSLKHVRKALTITSEILEEATRVQEFSRARQQGRSEQDAANLSKAVSMNFARAGQLGRKLNMVVAFFNAGVQDMDQIMRQHADPKRRGSVMMKGFMYITIPSLLAWALGKDDEEIQNLPDWRKNLFWNFNLKPLAAALGRPGFILSLPKPFLMGQLYGTSIERALDQATARDPNGAEKAAWAIVENTAFHGDLTDFIPTAIKPLFLLALNRDTFRNADIVPDHMKHLPAAAQVNAGTSMTAQAVGSTIGFSPLIIDHLIQGHLSGLGRLGSDAIDWAVTKMTTGDKNPGPSTDLFEWQPFKSFVGSPYAADGNVNRFYEAANDMEGLLRTWHAQAPTLTRAEDSKLWDKSGPEIVFYEQIADPRTKLTQAGRIRQAMKHMSDLNRAMKLVHGDSSMSGDQKRATLIDLSQTRNQTAKAAYQLFPEPVRKRHY